MKKYKIYLISALVALVLCAIGIYIRSNRCECVKYQKYDQVIINSDMTAERTTDSICVMGGNRRGQLMMKKFRK